MENINKSLPYALTKIHVKDLLGLKDAGFQGIPEDTKCIVITGENGSGKTALLNSVAIGLYRPSGITPIAEIELICNGEVKNSTTSSIDSFKNVAVYGANRGSVPKSNPMCREWWWWNQKWINKHHHLFRDESNSAGQLIRYFLDEIFDTIKANEVKKVICKFMRLFFRSFDPIEVDGKFHFVSNGALVDFEKLGSGAKGILFLISSMMFRLFESQKDTYIPSELNGIVLIDEIEAHLHPNIQTKILDLLCTEFPLVQFIISTNSALPLVGAPEKTVILKTTNTGPDGVKVELVDVNFRELLPTAIFTSPIFGLEKLVNFNVDPAKVHTEDNFSDVQDTKQTKKDLNDFTATGPHIPVNYFIPDFSTRQDRK